MRAKRSHPAIIYIILPLCARLAPDARDDDDDASTHNYICSQKQTKWYSIYNCEFIWVAPNPNIRSDTKNQTLRDWHRYVCVWRFFKSGVVFGQKKAQLLMVMWLSGSIYIQHVHDAFAVCLQVLSGWFFFVFVFEIRASAIKLYTTKSRPSGRYIICSRTRWNCGSHIRSRTPNMCAHMYVFEHAIHLWTSFTKDWIYYTHNQRLYCATPMLNK